MCSSGGRGSPLGPWASAAASGRRRGPEGALDQHGKWRPELAGFRAEPASVEDSSGDSGEVDPPLRAARQVVQLRTCGLLEELELSEEEHLRLEVGYGDVSVISTPERIYSIFAMMLGAVTFAYLLGNMQNLIAQLDTRAVEP